MPYRPAKTCIIWSRCKIRNAPSCCRSLFKITCKHPSAFFAPKGVFVCAFWHVLDLAGICCFFLPENLFKQKAHQRTAEKQLPQKRHREVAHKRLQPFWDQLKPGLFENQRCPKTHNGAHKANGHTGAYCVYQKRLVFVGRHHFKGNFRRKTVHKEKAHYKTNRKNNGHFFASRQKICV